MAKKKYPKIVSPVGAASFPWLNKPDSGQKYSDDKFKVTLVFDKDDPAVEKITAKAKEAAKLEWGKVPSNLNMPFRDGDEIAEDKDKPEYKGKYLMIAKTKYQPGVVGPDRGPLDEGTFISGGDLIRFSAVLFPYKAGTAKGVTCQLSNVQLVEKRAGFGNAADDFDDDLDDYDTSSESSEESAEPEGSEDDDDVDF